MLAAFGRHLVEPNKLGLAFGFLESANSFSIILAPLLAGFLYAKNPESIYQVTIILVGVILILNALILFRI